MHLKLVAVIVLCFFMGAVSGQDKLALKQQYSLDQVTEVISGGRQNVFLAKSENNYILIDQASKLQLGALQLDLSGTAIPGVEKMYLWGDSNFIISSGRELLLADVITGKVDTLFNVKFPEFIINYTPLPWNEHLLLIAAKTYPVNKDNTVTFEHADKLNNMVHDDTKNCRLILFDAAAKKIISSAAVPYAVTCFAQAAVGHKILAGSFDGDIVAIDALLTSELVYHAFSRPVHSLLYQQGLVVAVPHIAPKYLGISGDSTISIYNIATRSKKEIQLTAEKPVVQSEYGMNPLPSGSVRKILSWPQDSCILVNYGFSRLLKISLPSLDTAYFPMSFNAANFYCFNKDSTQLLAATAPYPGIFKLSGDLVMYDLHRRKVQSSFNKPAEKIKYEHLYKLYDAQGNYHYIGHKTGDTLIVYSSNKTAPTQLICLGCNFGINEHEGSITVTNASTALYGSLRLSSLSRDQYIFGSANSIFYPEEVFTPLINTSNLKQNSMPYGASAISSLGKEWKLVSGNYPKAKKTISWMRVIDSAGQVKFTVPEHEYGVHDAYKASASFRYLAFISETKSAEQLEVWDVAANKKIFTRSFPGRSFNHFTFDKTKDVIFYSLTNLQSGKPTEVYKADLITPVIKEQFLFSNNGFFSFQVDIAHDLIASEAYSQLSLHRLSTMQLLWQLEPSTTYFKVMHLPDGFGYASEQEYHIIKTDLSYLYFTSFAGFRPVEILNNRLYKGDKSAINNLAFVLRRRAFMPGDFDMYFNRPDSVLLVSGSTNTTFNQLTAKAVEKRKKHQPVKELEDFLNNRPQLTIAGGNNVADVTDAPSLKLTLQARSVSGKPITAFHVSDNGVPVFGSIGFPAAAKINVEATITIPLVKGQNAIQLYAEDAAGFISATENISIVADYAAPPEKVYYIGIGIDHFADSRHDLQYSAKDVRDLAQKLKEKYGDAIVIDTLFNEQVTVNNVRALKQKLKQAHENDKVIISYSGHGLLSKEFDYYLSTYNVNFKNPQENGLPYDALEWLLDSIPARKKLMLIDACHSGEVDKDEAFAMNKTADSLGLIKPKGGEVVLVDNGQQVVGLKNSFELMQSLFVNVGKSTGATIISGAAGNQFALEAGDLRNGVFTYAILETINKYPTIKISELKKIVGERVEQLTQGMQKPTSRNETIVADWSLW
jgi:hypothetical protein